ncbi:hypothetical protein GRF29_154g479061 [Pseudopithomyces chartarum]|uniref:Arginase n=1 Tax=Pseudopithomyces chartarum TaxID=1892770 RepID=A0AAN6RDP1_9PLEO|nr:hypothetical protein GRF29_154g479061 [Pseudopithomyces chartarum]
MLALRLPIAIALLLSAAARKITFPPAIGLMDQRILGHGGNIDVTSGPAFAGLTTYANLPYVHCLAGDDEVEKYDIAILGAPFDTLARERDLALEEFDKALGELRQRQLGIYTRIVSGRTSNSSDFKTPRIVTLGGDHTTTLSALRSTYHRWGPVSVIHFDSHIDTWDPDVLGGGISSYAGVNHGTFLHIAHEEGLIRNTSIHAGIRAPMVRPKGDMRNDIRCGFQMIKARDIDRIGINGVIDRLKERVAGSRVYISVDIDVLDPAYAPG